MFADNRSMKDTNLRKSANNVQHITAAGNNDIMNSSMLSGAYFLAQKTENLQFFCLAFL